MAALKDRIVRSIIESIPSGFLVGRISRQDGRAELIPISEIGKLLVLNGSVSPGPGGPGGSVVRADFVVFWSGKTIANTVFAEIPMTLAITIPAGLAGSQFTARVAATADYTITLLKNGSSVGTIVFHAVGSPTITVASAISLAVGDIFAITGQASADTTLADIGLGFKASVT